MSGLLAVTWREVQERRFLLPVAAGAGLLPLLLRLLAPSSSGLRTTAEVLALLVLVALPMAVGISLGASVLGRDLAERRLGFYFARPLSGGSIWGGKMLAAALLTAATAALLLALSYSVIPSLFPGFVNTTRAASLFVLVPLLGLIAAHTLASVFRARSGLIQYDAVAFLVCAAGAGWIVKTMLDAGAWRTLDLFPAPGAAGLIVVLLLASAAQIIVGRTDVRRGHRALSTVVWGSAAVGILAGGLFVHWVLSIVPEAHGTAEGRPSVYVSPAPAGNYFFLVNTPGRAGYRPLFLMNAATGRFVNIGANAGGWLVGADGRHAVWIESAFSRAVLVKARLDGPEPVITRVPLDLDGWPKALSADGSRVLISNSQSVRAYETDSGRLVAQARIADVRAASFLAAGEARLYHAPLGERRTPDQAIVVSDWDLGTGAFAERGRIGRSARLRIHNFRGRGLLVEERSGTPGGPAALALYDAESGRRERTLLDAVSGLGAAAWLHDGRIAVITNGTPRAHLRVFDDAGHESLSAELPKPRAFWAGEAGTVFVLGSFDDSEKSAADAVFVDMKSGAIRVEAALSPARASRSWTGYDDPTAVAAADSLAARLFHGRNGGLFFFDPASGEKRTLLPAE